MHKNCPNCSFKFEKEPGFFFGAMFINYALGAAETLVLEPRVSLNVGSILSANITGANASSNISINAFGVEII